MASLAKLPRCVRNDHSATVHSEAQEASNPNHEFEFAADRACFSCWRRPYPETDTQGPSNKPRYCGRWEEPRAQPPGIENRARGAPQKGASAWGSQLALLKLSRLSQSVSQEGESRTGSLALLFRKGLSSEGGLESCSSCGTRTSFRANILPQRFSEFPAYFLAFPWVWGIITRTSAVVTQLGMETRVDKASKVLEPVSIVRDTAVVFDQASYRLLPLVYPAQEAARARSFAEKLT